MTTKHAGAVDLDDLDRRYEKDDPGCTKGNGAAGAALAPLVGVPLEELIKMTLPERPRCSGPGSPNPRS